MYKCLKKKVKMHWHGVAVVRKVHIFKDVWVRGLSADGGALSSPHKMAKK